jgi:cytochrome P450
VPENAREAVAADVLPSGVRVGAGWDVAVIPWAMARLPELWGPDAASFRPLRWLETNATSDEDGSIGSTARLTPRRVSPFVNPVFWGGPRQCLGMDMAQLEVKMVVSRLLPRFCFQRPASAAPATYGLSLTMPLLDGLPVYVTERPTSN